MAASAVVVQTSPRPQNGFLNWLPQVKYAYVLRSIFIPTSQVEESVLMRIVMRLNVIQWQTGSTFRPWLFCVALA